MAVSPAVNNPGNYIFMASLNQMRKKQPREDIRMGVYIRSHIFICLCICVLPYVYILMEPRTTGTHVRFLRVGLGLLQPSPKHIRDDDKTTGPHTERPLRCAACRGPDTEAKPRATRLRVFYCSSARRPMSNFVIKSFKTRQNEY